MTKNTKLASMTRRPAGGWRCRDPRVRLVAPDNGYPLDGSYTRMNGIYSAQL